MLPHQRVVPGRPAQPVLFRRALHAEHRLVQQRHGAGVWSHRQSAGAQHLGMRGTAGARRRAASGQRVPVFCEPVSVRVTARCGQPLVQPVQRQRRGLRGRPLCAVEPQHADAVAVSLPAQRAVLLGRPRNRIQLPVGLPRKLSAERTAQHGWCHVLRRPGLLHHVRRQQLPGGHPAAMLRPERRGRLVLRRGWLSVRLRVVHAPAVRQQPAAAAQPPAAQPPASAQSAPSRAANVRCGRRRLLQYVSGSHECRL